MVLWGDVLPILGQLVRHYMLQARGVVGYEVCVTFSTCSVFQCSQIVAGNINLGNPSGRKIKCELLISRYVRKHPCSNGRGIPNLSIRYLLRSITIDSFKCPTALLP